MASHTTNRIQVVSGRSDIRYAANATPSSGSTGDQGTRYGRGISGRVRRRMITPIQTRMKASRVPIDVMWPSWLIGRKPPSADVNTSRSWSTTSR